MSLSANQKKHVLAAARKFKTDDEEPPQSRKKETSDNEKPAKPTAKTAAAKGGKGGWRCLLTCLLPGHFGCVVHIERLLGFRLSFISLSSFRATHATFFVVDSRGTSGGKRSIRRPPFGTPAESQNL